MTRTKLFVATAVAAAFALFPAGTAMADVSDGLTYVKQGGHIMVTGCDGGVGSCANPLVIPSTIEGLPVAEIGSGAFQRASFSAITLPSTLTAIRSNAFEEASNISSIVIPEGVTEIDSDAFHKATKLASVSLPSTLTYLGDEAFYQAFSLTNITLPSGLTYLGSGAFATTLSLTGITIPDSVTSILPYTFAGSAISSVTLPSGLTGLPEGAFQGASNLTSVTIPATVESLGNNVFRYDTKLADVYFQGNAPSLGGHVFSGTASRARANLATTALTGFGYNGERFGDLVVSGGLDRFTYSNAGDHIVITGCVGGLGSCPDPLVIPDTLEGLPVTEIGARAFAGAWFAAVTLPSTLTTISGNAFEGAGSLTSIAIPEGVTTIGSDVFHAAGNLESVTLPSTLTSLGDEAFYGAHRLTAVTLPAGLTYLGNGAFADTWALTAITIPGSVSAILPYTFAGSGISSVTLSEGLTFISEGAFQGVRNLTSVTIPATVGGLGNNAFRYDSKLADVYFEGNAPGLSNNVFAGTATGAKAHLSSTSLTGYGYNGYSFGGLIVTGGTSRPIPRLTAGVGLTRNFLTKVTTLVVRAQSDQTYAASSLTRLEYWNHTNRPKDSAAPRRGFLLTYQPITTLRAGQVAFWVRVKDSTGSWSRWYRTRFKPGIFGW